MGAFKEPHGGTLRDCYLTESAAEEEKVRAGDYPVWSLTARQLCDLDMLTNGAFSPLEGFNTQAQYESICRDMRLPVGVLWPMPICLDVSDEFAGELEVGKRIALRDPEGVLLATMDVEDIYTPDKAMEAERIYGTQDDTHPGVNYLMNTAGSVYLGGRVYGIEPRIHYDFKLMRDTPAELRGRFRKLGWRKIVAFQTHNPMHRAHQELTFRAAKEVQANLLIHPTVGLSKPGDINHFTRVRCYEHILEEYPEQTTALSLVNLAMRMAGPRETIWHAIIRKNYGCTHLIVGADHAGAGEDKNGQPFYQPYAAQELFSEHEQELDIAMVPFRNMVYAENRAQYVAEDETDASDKVLSISSTEFRRRLTEGLDIPDWFSYPKVISELQRAYPPRGQQGFTVFFTGLSGSGKSTIANALMVKLMEDGRRPVTLLDGDVVRQNLSSELTFSKEHRDLNIQRIGYVASEITKNRGIAICAPIAPYSRTRKVVRDLIEPMGGFIEVHVATSVEECERRDRKGLYKLAREGKIKEFTGISDPYEAPENPEVYIDTEELTPDLAAHRVLLKLESMGYIV
jgi:sulfate adenylyltransferase